MSERRSYHVFNVNINNIEVNEVIIDPHVYKHTDHIDDELILSLVLQLNLTQSMPEYKDELFSYFVSRILYESKMYKVVWLLEKNNYYIGILTAFRDRRLK